MVEGLGDHGVENREGYLTPRQSRQEARDRTFAMRMQRTLQTVGIISVIIFFAFPTVDDYSQALASSRTWDLIGSGAFIAPAAVALAAAITCRRPARQQVGWLDQIIASTGQLTAIMGGFGIGVGVYTGRMGIAMVSAATLILGLATAVLWHKWRVRWRRAN